MKRRITEFLKTPQGKLCAAVGALVLVWVIILLAHLDNFDTLFPDESRIADAKRELIRAKKTYDKAIADRNAADQLLKNYNQVIEGAWKEEKHGMVDTEFRRLISQAARSVELTLDSLGAVKTSRINADFYYAELDVSVRTGYEELIKFIQAVDKVSPRVSWRRFDIRPDRRPPHLGGANNQGSITARVLSEDNSSKITTRVGFNGTLRMIGFDGKVAVRNPKTGGSAK